MQLKTRVYVAGPISKGPLQANIDQARKAGAELMRLGYAPLVPHLTCFMAGNVPEVLPNGTTAADWYATDLPWVAVCDAVLRLPGESVGADAEVGLARDHGIPVYYSVEELAASATPRGSHLPFAMRTRIAAAVTLMIHPSIN